MRVRFDASRQRTRIWGVGLLLVLALTGGAVAWAAPATQEIDAPAPQADAPTRGVGSDPLTLTEEQQALEALWTLQGANPAGVRSASVNPDIPDAPTISAPMEAVLLVERHMEEKGDASAAASAGVPLRRADLFLYRYADDVLVVALHDLTSGATTIVEEARGVQLPLTEAERALAVQIAFADPALFAYMQEEHRTIVGEVLTGPEQVEVRAFVYHSGAAPETEPPDAAACGIQRCAQLLILTGNNVTYSILPIVNLSTLRAASVIPLAVQEQQPGLAPEPHEHGASGGTP